MVAAMHVVVVGGGVAGLGSALVLARQGHEVTVVERDDTPMPQSADEAFEWDRRGAPQVRHSHAFLARLVGLLKSDYPDVYSDCWTKVPRRCASATTCPPPWSASSASRPTTSCRCWPAANDVRVGAAHGALAEGRVEFRTGVAVEACWPAQRARPTRDVTAGAAGRWTPRRRDLVVVAAGRRSALPEWLAAHRCPRRGSGRRHRHRLLQPLLPTARRGRATRRAPVPSGAISAT